MIAKMTSHIGQIALAALAAMALTFPSPRDARDALEKAFYPSVLRVEASPEEAVISPRGTPTIRIGHDTVAECLSGVDTEATQALNLCAEEVYLSLVQSEIDETYGSTPPLATPAAYSDRGYESSRLALTQLCRALWKASDGSVQPLESSACRYAVSGVEQFVGMQ